jgi:transcriptional regulator NrdR family protein
MANTTPSIPERFACNECGQVFATFDQAATCHWGIGCAVSSRGDPAEFTAALEIAALLADLRAAHPSIYTPR